MLRGRQHLRGVLQHPGRIDDVVAGHGQLDVVVAEVEVELALPRNWSVCQPFTSS